MARPVAAFTRLPIVLQLKASRAMAGGGFLASSPTVTVAALAATPGVQNISHRATEKRTAIY